jgi:hypothetical protein
MSQHERRSNQFPLPDNDEERPVTQLSQTPISKQDFQLIPLYVPTEQDSPLIPIERIQKDALHELLNVLEEMKPISNAIFCLNEAQLEQKKSDPLNRAAEISLFINQLYERVPIFQEYLKESEADMNLFIPGKSGKTKISGYGPRYIDGNTYLRIIGYTGFTGSAIKTPGIYYVESVHFYYYYKNYKQHYYGFFKRQGKYGRKDSVEKCEQLSNTLLKTLWNTDRDKAFVSYLASLSYEDIVQCFYATLGYDPNPPPPQKTIWQRFRRK